MSLGNEAACLNFAAVNAMAHLRSREVEAYLVGKLQSVIRGWLRGGLHNDFTDRALRYEVEKSLRKMHKEARRMRRTPFFRQDF